MRTHCFLLSLIPVVSAYCAWGIMLGTEPLKVNETPRLLSERSQSTTPTPRADSAQTLDPGFPFPSSGPSAQHQQGNDIGDSSEDVPLFTGQWQRRQPHHSLLSGNQSPTGVRGLGPPLQLPEMGPVTLDKTLSSQSSAFHPEIVRLTGSGLGDPQTLLSHPISTPASLSFWVSPRIHIRSLQQIHIKQPL